MAIKSCFLSHYLSPCHAAFDLHLLPSPLVFLSRSFPFEENIGRLSTWCLYRKCIALHIACNRQQSINFNPDDDSNIVVLGKSRVSHLIADPSRYR